MPPDQSIRKSSSTALPVGGGGGGGKQKIEMHGKKPPENDSEFSGKTRCSGRRWMRCGKGESGIVVLVAQCIVLV